MTSFTQIFQEIAERHTEHAPMVWVETRPLCARCRYTEVDNHGDNCPLCVSELERGYEALTMTGRCANGAQRDSGTLYHAVKIGDFTAMCGAKHGKRSRWSEYHGKNVTCPRCLKKLTKG